MTKKGPTGDLRKNCFSGGTDSKLERAWDGTGGKELQKSTVDSIKEIYYRL